MKLSFGDGCADFEIESSTSMDQPCRDWACVVKTPQWKDIGRSRVRESGSQSRVRYCHPSSAHGVL
jgi:hypothetical protein